MRKSIRTGLFGSLTLGIHIWMIFQIFIAHNILASLAGLLIFFLVFHFFYLDLYIQDNKRTILGILLITLIEIIILNFFWDLVMIWGLIVMNGTILYLSRLLEESANQSISFKAMNYFTNWWYFFTFGMSIAYSLFTMGIYHNFPFRCNDLNQTSANVVQSITKPFNVTRLQNSDNNAKILSQTKVSDLVAVGKIFNIESAVKIPQLEQFKTRKDNLITKTLSENKELNQWICEFTLSKLNVQLKNPWFQIGVIVLMVAVVYPFLRIVIFIMSIIWLFLFEIMKWTKLYSIEKVMTEVEKIG